MLNDFDLIVKQVFEDKRTHSIPSLFIVQLLVVLDDLDLLKENLYDEYALYNE